MQNALVAVLKMLFFLLFLSLNACNKSEENKDAIKDYNRNVRASPNATSVAYKQGRIYLDTNVIQTNQNLVPLISDLRRTELVEKKTFDEVPVFINSFLDSLTYGNFSIANPGQEWQEGCMNVSDSASIPPRQLLYLGIGNDIALLTYFTGLEGKSEHILIFKYIDNRVVDFWSGTVLEDLKDKEAILNYLEENKDNEFGLNSYTICI